MSLVNWSEDPPSWRQNFASAPEDTPLLLTDGKEVISARIWRDGERTCITPSGVDGSEFYAEMDADSIVGWMPTCDLPSLPSPKAIEPPLISAPDFAGHHMLCTLAGVGKSQVLGATLRMAAAQARSDAVDGMPPNVPPSPEILEFLKEFEWPAGTAAPVKTSCFLVPSRYNSGTRPLAVVFTPELISAIHRRESIAPLLPAYSTFGQAATAMVEHNKRFPDRPVTIIRVGYTD